MVYVVLNRHYPDFRHLFNDVHDPRQRKGYQACELLMAGLVMFLFRRGSRNAMDTMWTPTLEANYFELFGMRLPVMDSVDHFLRRLPECELQSLKRCLVSHLLQKKVFQKWKVRGRYLVSIDGTGLYSYDYEPYKGCPYKTSKNGKRTWQCYVLEAKLVCPNGFSVSIGSCHLVNGQALDDKQDCEQKAFVRLAKILKEDYPHLPLLVLADGLYPNQTVFETCRANGWSYVITLKDKSLLSVWQEIGLLQPLQAGQRATRTSRSGQEGWREESLRWVTDIGYHTHRLNWLEYERKVAGSEQKERFCHVTDLSLSDGREAWQLSDAGRQRWRIENEGFNTQKHHGFAMQHKYSRHHPVAQGNYYQLLQMAHLLSQLTEKLLSVQQAIKAAKTTLKAIIEDMVAAIRNTPVHPQELLLAIDINRQLRY